MIHFSNLSIFQVISYGFLKVQDDIQRGTNHLESKIKGICNTDMSPFSHRAPGKCSYIWTAIYQEGYT